MRSKSWSLLCGCLHAWMLAAIWASTSYKHKLSSVLKLSITEICTNWHYAIYFYNKWQKCYFVFFVLLAGNGATYQTECCVPILQIIMWIGICSDILNWALNFSQVCLPTLRWPAAWAIMLVRHDNLNLQIQSPNQSFLQRWWPGPAVTPLKLWRGVQPIKASK